MRSASLTLPGFTHDACSAVHPMALASPFFQSLPLSMHGLSWIQPPVPLAHPLDEEEAVCLYRNLDETANHLGADAANSIFDPGRVLEKGRHTLWAYCHVPHGSTQDMCLQSGRRASCRESEFRRAGRTCKAPQWRGWRCRQGARVIRRTARGPLVRRSSL